MLVYETVKIDVCEKILITPMYGEEVELQTIEDALAYIDEITGAPGGYRLDLNSFDIKIYFKNNEKIAITLNSKEKAVKALQYVYMIFENNI